jgi:hypothetical protein
MEPDVLPYADLPDRWGVTLERGEHFVRVTVPPVPLRHLGLGFFLGGGLLAGCCFVLGVIAWRSKAAGDYLFPVVLYLAAFGAVVVAAVLRMTRRTVIDVTPTRLLVRSVRLHRSHVVQDWPRALIAEVRRNRSSGQMFVRVVGTEAADVYVSPSAEVTDWVARQIADAHAKLPVDPSTISSPSEADRFDPPMTTASPPLRSRRARRALVGLGLAMFVGGAVMCAMDFPWQPIGFYLMLLAAAPIGIALGTQAKRTYFP